MVVKTEIVKEDVLHSLDDIRDFLDVDDDGIHEVAFLNEEISYEKSE